MSGEGKLRWVRPKWSDNGEVETGKKIAEQKKPSSPERGGDKAYFGRTRMEIYT